MPRASPPKPIFLLADSQMLFWKEGEQRFLTRAARALDVPPDRAKAAYLGASNGDAPEFFEIFQAAFADVGLVNCMHVHEEPSSAERAFLEDADLILLAGGDAALGYRAFEAAQLVGLLRNRWSEGALLIGVSAGAVLMGTTASESADTEPSSLALVPYVVAVHEEPAWECLGSIIERLGGTQVGFGIPTAGAAIVHPDLSVEPIRKPITEVTLQDGVIARRDLLSAAPPSTPPTSKQRDLSLN